MLKEIADLERAAIEAIRALREHGFPEKAILSCLEIKMREIYETWGKVVVEG